MKDTNLIFRVEFDIYDNGDTFELRVNANDTESEASQAFTFSIPSEGIKTFFQSVVPEIIRTIKTRYGNSHEN